MKTRSTADKSDTHLTEDLDERFRCLVKHAVCAPSGHNTQPWLFRRDGDSLELLADRTRGLPVVDPNDRELTISCGAALDHMQVAARHYGWELDCDICPDSGDVDVLARVEIRPSAPPNDVEKQLFNAIAHRRTSRTNYEDRVLPLDVVERCRGIAVTNKLEFTMVTDRETRLAVADLVADADRIQFADIRFRRELASWVHSRRRASKDGMSGTSFGLPDVLSPVGALVIRSFDLGDGVAADEKNKIVGGSPTIAVLSSARDRVSDWIATGQVLSRILLTLTAAGATASYLNAPLEVDNLRYRVSDTVGSRGHPQLLLRLGYGPLGEPTVRREVYDVLLN